MEIAHINKNSNNYKYHYCGIIGTTFMVILYLSIFLLIILITKNLVNNIKD